MAHPMGASTCAALAGCKFVRRPAHWCPDGGHGCGRRSGRGSCGFRTARSTASARSVCGLSRCRCRPKNGKIKYVDGRTGPANEGCFASRGCLALTIFTTHTSMQAQNGAKMRRPASDVDPSNSAPPISARRPGTRRCISLPRDAQDRSTRCRRFWFGQMHQRGSLSVSKNDPAGFGHNNVDHCTRLCHASSVAALMENVGSGAVYGDLQPDRKRGCGHRDWREPD